MSLLSQWTGGWCQWDVVVEDIVLIMSVKEFRMESSMNCVNDVLIVEFF